MLGRFRLLAEHRRRRPAFTLVELLVVIAIIGILVSLLLPAVQAAREAARRISCQNNLKQLAIGTQNYHDTYRVFPASGIVDTSLASYESRSGSMISWAVLMLPFIEQQPLHSQFNFSASVLAQAASDPQAAQLSVHRCPSDSAQGRFFQHASLTNNRRLGKGNYVAFVSPFHTELQSRFPAALTSHVPHNDATIHIDGSTNTLLFSEVLTRDDPADQRGAWAIAWNGASVISFDMHDARPVVFGESGYIAGTISLGSTQRPNNQGPNIDMLYDCTNPANAQVLRMPCDTWVQGTSSAYLSAAPRSHHPGGVYAAYVDGHVSLLPNEIDEMTMAYLISVGDSQVVQAP